MRDSQLSLHHLDYSCPVPNLSDLMEAIGAASAIIGVAQFGIQFSQVLITVIGDYKDAAKNINGLRDEIHLTAICLKQLGDLATKDLLREYGLLEATNLRERCQAVFWDIRTTIRKSDTPLHPTEITKDQIDVSNFTSLRWALWTKSKLEGSREELDRLKNSMTLCFVSHMAILATTDSERVNYAAQIPGIKRSLAWSEKPPDEDYFRNRLKAAGVSDDQIAKILGDDDVEFTPAEHWPSNSDSNPTRPIEPPPADMPDTQTPDQPPNQPILRAWSIDPLARTSEIPVSQEWLKRYVDQRDQGSKDILDVQSKLHPWFKNELNNIFQGQQNDSRYSWSLVQIKQFHRHLLGRGAPKSVHVIMRGLPKSLSVVKVLPILASNRLAAYTYDEPTEVAEYAEEVTIPIGRSSEYQYAAPTAEAASYDEVIINKLSDDGLEQETDEEIIAKQLALYQ